MNRRVPLAAALAAALLAGCLAADAPPEPPGPAPEFETPISRDTAHDHSDPAEHRLWTPNLRLLAFHSLSDDPAKAIGQYGEMDAWRDPATGRTLLAVAVTGMAGETPGFVILDVTDPAAPELLSFTASPHTGRLADVKFHPSGQWLVAGAQSGTRPKQPGPFLLEPDAPSYYATQNGLRVYDVSDPAAPALLQQEPSRTGYGCHMVSLATIDGADWLFCVGRTIEVWSFDGGRAEFRSHYAPQSTAGVANIPANEPKTNPLLLYDEVRLSVTPHDVTFQLDPVDGRPLLLVSWWDLGIRIVDVSDPTTPKEVGAWAGEGAERFEGNAHTGLLAVLGGKRVLLASPELISDGVPALWLVDASDLSAPRYVSEWTAPGEFGAAGLRLSTHNFQVVGERVYLSYYHAGVWVLDIAAPESPAIVGYYLPHEEIEPVAPDAEWAPSVWDVVVANGAIFASDTPSGLYVLHEASDPLGDPTWTSFA